MLSSLTVLASLALLVMGVLVIREAVRQRKRARELRQINQLDILARDIQLNAYGPPQAVYFASDGTPLYSWRFLFHIAGGSDDKSKHLDASWEASANAEWRKRAIPIFCWGHFTDTSVFAVTGEGTCFDGQTVSRWIDVPGDTLILVESNVPQLHWMQPGDISVEELDRNVPASEKFGIRDEDFLVAFADVSVWRLSAATPVKHIAEAARINGEDGRERLSAYRILESE